MCMCKTKYTIQILHTRNITYINCHAEIVTEPTQKCLSYETAIMLYFPNIPNMFIMNPIFALIHGSDVYADK